MAACVTPRMRNTCINLHSFQLLLMLLVLLGRVGSCINEKNEVQSSTIGWNGRYLANKASTARLSQLSARKHYQGIIPIAPQYLPRTKSINMKRTTIFKPKQIRLKDFKLEKKLETNKHHNNNNNNTKNSRDKLTFESIVYGPIGMNKNDKNEDNEDNNQSSSENEIEFEGGKTDEASATSNLDSKFVSKFTNIARINLFTKAGGIVPMAPSPPPPLTRAGQSESALNKQRDSCLYFLQLMERVYGNQMGISVNDAKKEENRTRKSIKPRKIKYLRKKWDVEEQMSENEKKYTMATMSPNTFVRRHSDGKNVDINSGTWNDLLPLLPPTP